MQKLVCIIATASGVGLAATLAPARANTEIVGDVVERYVYDAPVCGVVGDDGTGCIDHGLVTVLNVTNGNLVNVKISAVSGTDGPFTVAPGKSTPFVDQGDSGAPVTITGSFNGASFWTALPGSPGTPVSHLPVLDLDYLTNTALPPVLVPDPFSLKSPVLIGELVVNQNLASAVPEPSTWILTLLGFVCLGPAYRRRAKGRFVRSASFLAAKI